MTTLIIIVAVLLLAAMVYFYLKLSAQKDESQTYIQKITYFFEGKVMPILDNPNSHSVVFKYRGYDCLYEDVDIPGLFKGSSATIGYLKVKAQSPLTLSFTERSRTQIRSTSQSLDDLSKSRWGNVQRPVELPKSMENFQTYTNRPELATKFINTPKVLKIFESYINRDARGHPLQSLKVVDGTVVLEFHSIGGLKPSLLEMQYNVTSLEHYLLELIVLVDVLNGLTAENNAK